MLDRRLSFCPLVKCASLRPAELTVLLQQLVTPGDAQISTGPEPPRPTQFAGIAEAAYSRKAADRSLHILFRLLAFRRYLRVVELNMLRKQKEKV